MATVKIGKELRDNILKRARGLFSAKRTKLEEEMTKNKDYGYHMYHIIMSPYLPVVAQLPKEFFRQISDFNFSIEGVTFPYTFPTKQPWFYELPRNNLIREPGYYSYEVKLQNEAPEWAQYREVALEYKVKREEIHTHETQFISGVEKVLNAYSTLAPALKAWPALWDLLSDEVKDKHREVVDRRKNDPVQVDVDFSKLTSAVVAHKLGA